MTIKSMRLTNDQKVAYLHILRENFFVARDSTPMHEAVKFLEQQGAAVKGDSFWLDDPDRVSFQYHIYYPGSVNILLEYEMRPMMYESGVDRFFYADVRQPVEPLIRCLGCDTETFSSKLVGGLCGICIDTILVKEDKS